MTAVIVERQWRQCQVRSYISRLISNVCGPTKSPSATDSLASESVIMITVTDLIYFSLLVKSNSRLLQPEGPYLKTPAALTALFHYTLLDSKPVSFVFHNNWVPPRHGQGRHSNAAQKGLDVIGVTVLYCRSPFFFSQTSTVAHQLFEALMDFLILLLQYIFLYRDSYTVGAHWQPQSWKKKRIVTSLPPPKTHACCCSINLSSCHCPLSSLSVSVVGITP